LEEIGIFLAKYKNIAEIFSAEWFEKELKKPKNMMHLLAKQFTFKDALNNKISIHLFDHLEEYLGFLKREIQHNGKIVRKLRNFKEFRSVYAEIEIAAFLKD